jgi:hypothetical protein
MDTNTIIITRTIDANEMSALRAALRLQWPGVAWTIMHGRLLRDIEDARAVVGPSEYKLDPDVTTATVPPRFEA